MRPYNRVYATVNLDAVADNMKEMAGNLPSGTGMIGVVKADGYGHGSVQIASPIDPYVCGYAVATLEEGLILRRHGITKPILVLGVTPVEGYRELAEYGITVNGIAPGWIDTPMFHQATDSDPARLNKIMGRIPAKSVGDPMDVGMCAAFLCSEAARYINGTCIPVDGGALIGF